MSTDILTLRVATGLDAPIQRLVWTLPSALFICAITFIWFAFSMHQPAKHADEPAPINAELVELPAPAPAQAEQKIVTPPPVAKAIPQPKVMQSLAPEPQPNAPTAPAEPSPPQATPVAPAATPAPAPVAAGETHGAKAINQPIPVIPDELRQEYMNVTAVARFQIAEDGSSTVTLIKPTQNPRLNRLLLESLKNWRFAPALKDGKPVATSKDQPIRFSVK